MSTPRRLALRGQQPAFAKTRCAAAACALLLSLCASAVTAAPGISDQVVKVGVLTDMNSIFSELGGRGSVVATQMAIDDFKRDAKPAFAIEMVSADHQNKADIGANKAREWFDTQHVDIVVDAINSAVALAVSNVAREKKRLLFATGPGSMRLTNEECSPYTVSYTWDAYATSRPTVAALTKAGTDSWYFITVDYALGQSIEQEAAAAITAAGGKVIGSARHPLSTSDFSSFVLQAQASKAKGVAIANAGGDLINAVKAAREFGLARTQTIVPLSGTLNDVQAMGLAAAQGMVLTDAFYWNLNAQTREWSRRFFDKQKKMPNLIHAGTYSAVTNYLKAVQATGTDDADAVMKQMKSVRIDDMFAANGHIRDDGRMVHDMLLVQVKKPSESKEPWDFYNVKAVVPGDQAFQPLSESRCNLVRKP
jgi:branched-chain amino acid transport system substrate-binding protein